MSAAPGRPLPLLTLDNEFFWTSGADGTLRLQECKACESLVHPPAPVCRYCRSRDMGIRAVSGKAMLADCVKADGCDASALRAVRISTKLARSDPRL